MVMSFRIFKFSSNLFNFSKSFSSPSIKSLVNACLLLFLYHQIHAMLGILDYWCIALCYLPILASSNATLSIAKIQKLENLVSCDLILVLFFSGVISLSLLLLALAPQLVLPVLLGNLETGSEATQTLLDKDCLLVGIVLQWLLDETYHWRLCLFVQWAHSHTRQWKTFYVSYTNGCQYVG